jgi:sorbitol-specific phosphotransferase system component IIC
LVLNEVENLVVAVGGTAHSFYWVLKVLKPLAVVAVVVWLLIRFPRLWEALGLSRIERFAKKVAKRKGLCVFLVGLALFVIRGVGALLLGVPLPHYHDEFSYLLAADTFAHGRLTNPPHPMWVHFETFHVIWHPTYMSMYPPGQGLVLALGEVLGNPWIGQLLASALMCAAVCWMLQGWIPTRWALLGGVLVVARLGLLSYFTNGYWSACLPAVGGALILGTLPRMQHGARKIDAVIMGVGLFILANTRPYEGFLLGLGVAIALFAWMLGKDGPAARVSFARIVLPLVLTLAPLAAWTGYYYYRVTGSPFRMAYDVNREMYAMGRYFIWQKPWAQKTYHHAKMQAQYERELREANEYKTLRGFLQRGRGKLYYFWQVYLVPPLPFVLIALPCAARDRRLRVPWMILGIFVVGLAIEVWFLPHYFAPATALLYLFLMQCMRHLRWFEWRERAVGLAFVRAVCVIYVATVVLRIGMAVTHVHPEKEWQHGDMGRAAIVKELDAMPGKDVVLVRYAPDFDLDREWVFNGADIDGQKIVWARDMGAEKNRELLDYYPGRKFWMVEADGSAKLEPYPEQR